MFEALTFTTPWVLGALLILPVIWWLLRVTPPRPKQMSFPAASFLKDLPPQGQTAAHTPWWVILLRMLCLALLIAGLANPVLNMSGILPPRGGDGVIVIDNGWAAARDWSARQRIVQKIIDQAEREERKLYLIPTAQSPGEKALQGFGPLRPADARALMEKLKPMPWSTDHQAADAAVAALVFPGNAHVVWLGDGLEDTAHPGATQKLAARMAGLGGLTYVSDIEANPPYLLSAPRHQEGSGIAAHLSRALPAPLDLTLTASVSDDEGHVIATGEAVMKGGADSADFYFDVPPQIRSKAARISLPLQPTAATVVLLDGRWKKQRVGLIGSETAVHAYLDSAFYIRRALAPTAEITTAETVKALLDEDVSVIILPGAKGLGPADISVLESWVKKGGVLVQFASATMDADVFAPLLPVRLRPLDRVLQEGGLSWEKPQKLAAFAANSPFYGLEVPVDVTVSRQLLAEPALDLPEHVWAALTDGTPLVTAASKDKGLSILVHTTANAEWSNICLSGLFVQMLERMVAAGSGVAPLKSGEVLPALKNLDAFGNLTEPLPGMGVMTGDDAEGSRVSALLAPGYYGTKNQRYALNLVGAIPQVKPATSWAEGVRQMNYEGKAEKTYKPMLLFVALVLFLLDGIIALLLHGGLSLPRMKRAARMIVFFTMLLPAVSAQAQDSDSSRYAAQIWLAYAVTGDAQVDSISRAGLQSLILQLERRTAGEFGGAAGINPETDELSFFPMIYWPLTPGQATLSEKAQENLRRYLQGGGLIVFDTRDLHAGNGGVTDAAQSLRRVTANLQIGTLEPVDPNHAVTRSFYLLDSFPGRFSSGTLWVEKPEEGRNDGVPSVIVGSADWAGAWAIAQGGRGMLPIVGSGEEQREMAFRAGVNFVMLALTGNYKTDQVHVSHILERLGK